MAEGCFFIKMTRMRSLKKYVYFAALLLIFTTIGPACSCRRQPKYTRYSEIMIGYFDTLITLIGYTRTQEEFNTYFQQAEARFAKLHKLYDIYSSYEGINNLKTVNDMAGLKPVSVEHELLDLVKSAQKWTLSGHVKTNIALGPVLNIWHQYRREGLNNPQSAQLPSLKELEAAAKYSDARNIIIDEQGGTVYLRERGMSLDVGAVAKGYATELVARELEADGLVSGAINAGGNVRTIGKPLDGIRDRWGIGIFNPDSPVFSEDRNLDVVYINDASVVSSGDYQRYYYVQGVRYHHLVDPATLMPARYYRAVTVVTPDSGRADLLSTELFLLPYEESRQLAESLDDVEALWIMPDGEIKVTEGMAKLLRSYGASGKD